MTAIVTKHSTISVGKPQKAQIAMLEMKTVVTQDKIEPDLVSNVVMVIPGMQDEGHNFPQWEYSVV